MLQTIVIASCGHQTIVKGGDSVQAIERKADRRRTKPCGLKACR